jgi:thiamine-phosphate diphosphorylase/hydroxyethylthiazole kinase
VADLSPAIGALLVNFGTINDREGMFVAGRCANVNRKPLVYDPVAVGATQFRRDTSEREKQFCPCAAARPAAR